MIFGNLNGKWAFWRLGRELGTGCTQELCIGPVYLTHRRSNKVKNNSFGTLRHVKRQLDITTNDIPMYPHDVSHSKLHPT